MTAIGAVQLERSHGYCKVCRQPQFAADGLLGLSGWLTPRDFRLDFHETLEEIIGTGRAAGDIDIDRHEEIDPLHDGIGPVHPAGGSARRLRKLERGS